MRVLSGIQPTGRPHWGNYFGAISQYIALQNNEQAFYFIADLHALTTVRNAAQLRQNTLNAALDLLSLGLDPAQATLFIQSDICRRKYSAHNAPTKPASIGSAPAACRGLCA